MVKLLLEPGATARQDRDGAGRSVRFRRRTKVLAGVAAVAVALPLGAQALGALPALPGAFEQQTVDRSPAPLLVALADISEYHAATGTFQALVDVERDTPHVPALISGERTTLFATGHVDAVVDLGGLGPERVRVSADRRAVTFVLPAPRLAPATLDPEATRVVGRDRGIVERLASVVADDPGRDDELYRLAAQRLDAAARQSDLTVRAETNTREMLTSLARSLGYEQVTVEFGDPR